MQRRAEGALMRRLLTVALLFVSPLVFAQAQPPEKSVFILLDTSGSMGGNGMMMAQSALNTLLDEMVMDGDYRVALIKSSAGNVVVPLGANNIGTVRELVGFGHGGGNPATDLHLFSDGVLPRHPGCHVVLLVTDGDDGHNPVDAARSIKNKCSKLYIVGVGLDDNAERVLKHIAGFGGGRYCNGMDTSAVTRCVLSVFKQYQYNASRGACVDSNGFHGINPMPRLDRLARMDDWECYNFSGQDFTQGQLAALLSNRRMSHAIRGSDFSNARLGGLFLDSLATHARFRNADLAKANLRFAADSDHLDFTGAQLVSATITGKGGDVCFSNWDMTNAKLDSTSFHSLRLCKLKLSGTLTHININDVRMDGVMAGAGLKFADASGRNLDLFNVSGEALQFERGDVAFLVLAGTRVPTLAFTGFNANVRDPGSLTVRDARMTKVFTIKDSAFQKVDVSASSTPAFVLANTRGPVAVSRSTLGVGSITHSDELAFEESTIEKTTFSTHGRLLFTQSSVCRNCRFEGGGEALTVESSVLDDAAFKGKGAGEPYYVEASSSSMARSQWQDVAFDAGSSMENMRLGNSRFAKMTLDPILIDVNLSGSRFENASIKWVDGSENVTCTDCGAVRVDMDTDFARKLDFSRSQLSLSVPTHTRATLEALVVDGGALDGFLNGSECSKCRFEKATVKTSLIGATLIDAWAPGATFSTSWIHEEEPLTISGGNFAGAQFTGQGNLHVDASNANFSRAKFGPILLGQIAASNFGEATLAKGMRDTEAFNSDFSRAVIAEHSGGLHDVMFVKTKFSGAKFAALADSNNVTYEYCEFDGPYGRADIANLARRTKHLKLTGANWSGTDLHDIDMSTAEFVSVNLERANLRNASLPRFMDDVGLQRADLTNAGINGDISSSNLRGADVDGASFTGSITGTDMSGLVNSQNLVHFRSKLEDVDLSGNDLHNAHVRDTLLPVYQRLTLHDAIVSCEMVETMREHQTVTYGAYTSMNWDGLSDRTCQ